MIFSRAISTSHDAAIGCYTMQSEGDKWVLNRLEIHDYIYEAEDSKLLFIDSEP